MCVNTRYINSTRGTSSNRKRRTTQINLQHQREEEPQTLNAPEYCSQRTCIICDKKQKRLRGYIRYEKLVKCLRSDADTSTKKPQEIEVTGRVQVDLRTREAYYHESCPRKPHGQSYKTYASSSKGRQQYCYKEESYPWGCFQPYPDFHNPKYIKTEDRTIGAAQAEKMTMQQEWCCSYKQEKYLDFHNPKYIKTEEENSRYVWYKDKLSQTDFYKHLQCAVAFFPSMFFHNYFFSTDQVR